MDRNLRIRMLIEAGDRASRPLRDIAGGGREAADALKATRDKLKALDSEARSLRGFREAGETLRATRQELETTRRRVAELGREISATTDPPRKLTREFERARRQLDQLERAEQAQRGELKRTRAELRAAAPDVASLTQHERDLARRTEAANRELSEQGRRMQQINDRTRRFSVARGNFQRTMGAATGIAASGASGIATGIALGAPIADASREAMGFEDAMADVRKVVDGLETQAAFARMSNDVLMLSKRLPMAADGIAAIVAAGGQSGIKGRRDLLVFAEDATKMGIAFDITADEAGETMAKWRTAFAMNRDQVVDLADKVNYLGNTTAAKAPLITDIVTRIGPLGSVGGLASGSIAALGATLGGMGIESEIAATGIKNTMLALTKGEAATKSQQAAFDALGLSSTDVAKRMQRDAEGTIVDVMERLGRLPKDVQSGVLTQLFGSESVAAIAPMLTQLDTLRDNFAKVGDAQRYAGSMEAEYASRAATTSNAVQLANNQMRAAKIALGNELLPMVAQGAEWFGRFADRVSDFAQRYPGATRALLIGVGTFAALFAVLGGGAIVIAGLVAPFAALSFAAGTLGIGLLPVIGIAAGLVVGIVAVGAAIYALWANWDTISGYIVSRWQGLSANVGAQINGIRSAFAALPAAFLRIGSDMIGGAIAGITGRLGALRKTVVGAALDAAAWFKNALGIRSPSRVFMGFGNNIVDGLTNGIAAQEAEPIRRMESLSRRLSAAIVTSAAAPSLAMGAPGAGGSAPPAAPRPAMTVTINIYPQPGQDAGDIGEAVREAIERIDREQAAADRSTFADTDEWGS